MQRGVSSGIILFCNAAFHLGLFCFVINGISAANTMKFTPDNLKNQRVQVPVIRICMYSRQKWVKLGQMTI